MRILSAILLILLVSCTSTTDPTVKTEYNAKYVLAGDVGDGISVKTGDSEFIATKSYTNETPGAGLRIYTKIFYSSTNNANFNYSIYNNGDLLFSSNFTGSNIDYFVIFDL